MTSRTARAAALVALSAAIVLSGSASRVRGAAQPRAVLGIELPSLGLVPAEYTDETMQDIRDNLHATYVRTGWIPGWIYRDQKRHRAWRNEDRELRIVCRSGLRVMIIVPGVKENDAKTTDDLVENIRTFFTRYQERDPGCIRWAEVANEADLPQSGYPDVGAYAAYYARVAPIVASFGVTVITCGVSGEDRPWTATLAALLSATSPPSPVDGFGYHPYGTPVDQLATAVATLRQDAGGRPVYVTEIGQANPLDLYRTIVNLARVTPTITIYDYRRVLRENPKYSLKDNPALYAAVQRAWADALATPREP